MFGYMTTDYSTVEMLEEQELEAEGEWHWKYFLVFVLIVCP